MDRRKAEVDFRPLPYMEEYLTEQRVQLNTESHIKNTRLSLAHFSRFCREHGVMHPENLTRETLLDFQAWLGDQTGPDGEKWSKGYQALHQKYVRAWINWLHAVEHVTHNPWHHLKIPSVQKDPNPLDDEELWRLFDTHRRRAFTVPAFTYHRLEVILVLLYSWGLRVHELRSLNVVQMDMRQDFVNVKNKSRGGMGKKSMPYPSWMKEIVGRWLRVRARHAEHGEDALLINQDGTRLSYKTIRKEIVELGDKAGVSIHPHMLRDTCATKLVNSDMSLQRVAKLLGHSSTRQTERYTRVNNAKVADDHDRIMGPEIENLLFGRTSEPDIQPERESA